MISNYSRIKQFRLCKRKDYFDRVRRLATSKPKVELDFGTAVHEAIPMWLKTKSYEAAVASFDNSFSSYMNNPYLLPEQRTEASALQRQGHLSIQSYIETWREDFTLIMSEYQDKAELLDGKHSLAFRTDAVISVNGNLWLLERKTLSKNMSVQTFIETFKIDEQPTAYLIGLRKKTGLPISGFLLEIIRKTTIPEIIREPFLRTEEQLRDTEIGLYNTIQEMDDASFDLKDHPDPIGRGIQEIFPKTTGMGTCYQFFRPCAFLDLCVNARLEPFGEEFVAREPDYVDEFITKENEQTIAFTDKIGLQKEGE